MLRRLEDGRVERLSGKLTTVGSGDVDLHLDDDSVEPQHAVIETLANGEYRLRDLETKSGTRVNGILFSGSVVVGEGDRLQFGDGPEFELSAVRGRQTWTQPSSLPPLLSTEKGRRYAMPAIQTRVIRPAPRVSNYRAQRYLRSASLDRYPTPSMSSVFGRDQVVDCHR